MLGMLNICLKNEFLLENAVKQNSKPSVIRAVSKKVRKPKVMQLGNRLP